MVPTLVPGDRVLIDRRRAPRVGDVVTARFPDGTLVVKRAAEAVDVRGEPGWFLRSDNPDAPQDTKPAEPQTAPNAPMDDSTAKARYEAMRDMVAFAQRTSARGRGTAVLVYPAERMNTVTANALLKTLEEPAGDTRFVLASESAHQLLPTIRSRCQTHAMAWPSDGEAIAWLQTGAREAGLKEVGEAEARAWLQAAGGRPEDALVWAQTGLTAARWSQLPQALARGDWTLVSDWTASQQLVMLQKLCHDLMSVAAGAAPRFFPADSLPPAPRWAVLARWSKALTEAARTVEHPYNAGLMQEAWVAATRQVLTPRVARA